MKLKINNVKKSDFKSVSDFDFFNRVYNSDNSDYIERIKMIGFEKMDRVLDYGCGYGQWSIALSLNNNKVFSVDSSKERIEVFNKIIRDNEIKNIQARTGDAHQLDFPQNYFDAIFMYNVINLTDYKQTFNILKSLIKDTGYIYFNYYDLGWILHNIINEHNPSVDFSPRDWGLDAIYFTKKYYLDNKFSSSNGKDTLYLDTELLKDYLKKIGFKIIKYGGDGEINVLDNNTLPFFPKTKFDLNAVCEFLITKR